jgi:hypothetical protein
MLEDHKSTAGYFTVVGDNLIIWRSKKKNAIVLSSAEPEFRGMVKNICKFLWIRRELIELGFELKREIKLFCDNKATIDISHNSVQHDRKKIH